MDHWTAITTTPLTELVAPPTIEFITHEDAEQAAEIAALLAQLNADVDDEPQADEVGQEASNRNFVYHEIKEQLIAAGLPAHEIAFIQDAKTPAEREALFAKVRSGAIRVFMGSTMRMGVGVNVQERCYAVHHLTTPWRPCDVKQADGRIWRPGNLFPEVWICRYVAAPSFDGFSWQGIETKGRFEDAYLRGDPEVRVMRDIDEQIISAGELKALASGDPRIMQKVRLEHELSRLKQQHAAWETGRRQARLSAIAAEQEAQEVRARVERMRHYQAQRTADRSLTLFDTTHDASDPTQARAIGKAVRDALLVWGETTSMSDLKRDGRVVAPCGTYRGLPLHAVIDLDGNGKRKLPHLIIADRVDGLVRKIAEPLIYSGDIATIVVKLEAAAHSIDDRVGIFDQTVIRLSAEAARLREAVQAPWEHARTYRLMGLALDYLDAVLDENQSRTEVAITEVLTLAASEGLDINEIIKEGAAVEEQGMDLSTIRVRLPNLPQQTVEAQAEAVQPTAAPQPTAQAAPEPQPTNTISISIFADPATIARPTLAIPSLDLKDMATEAARKKAEITRKKQAVQQEAGQLSFF
jgi:hypothetical protein